MVDRRPTSGAVFLDRDGTIIEDPGYLHRPGDVRLLPGAREGLRRLANQGWPLVIASNQSGIARGLYDARAFYATMDRLHGLLSGAGVTIRAAYFCPHHPDVTGPCPCRKPGPRLFERAAADLGLDLAASWYVGDRFRDVQPAGRFGGRGLLVSRDPDGEDARRARDASVAVVPDLIAVARAIGVRGA